MQIGLKSHISLEHGSERLFQWWTSSLSRNFGACLHVHGNQTLKLGIILCGSWAGLGIVGLQEMKILTLPDEKKIMVSGGHPGQVVEFVSAHAF